MWEYKDGNKYEHCQLCVFVKNSNAQALMCLCLTLGGTDHRIATPRISAAERHTPDRRVPQEHVRPERYSGRIAHSRVRYWGRQPILQTQHPEGTQHQVSRMLFWWFQVLYT